MNELNLELFGKTKQAIKAAAVGVVLMGVSACAPDLGGLLAGPPAAVYELNAAADIEANDNWPIAAQITVEEPLSAIAYDTTKIVVHNKGGELQYLGGSRWADRAPRLTQELMVEAFENAGIFTGVARQSVGLRSDYVVHGELREFGVFVGDGQPRAEMRLTLNVVWPGNAQIVAHKTFFSSVEADGNSAADLVAAVDLAQKEAIKASILWIAESVAADIVARR